MTNEDLFNAIASNKADMDRKQDELFNVVVLNKADSDKKHEEVLGAILSLKDATEMHFVGSNERLDRVEGRLDRVEMRLGQLTARFESVEDGLKAVRTEVAGFQRRSG